MLTKTGSYYCDKEAVKELYSPTVRWGGRIYKGMTKTPENKEDGGLDRVREVYSDPDGKRNLRNFWDIPTEGLGTIYTPDGRKLDHFAAFPSKLPEICIKASTPEVGVCAKCGAPWARIIDVRQGERHDTEYSDFEIYGDGSHRGKHAEPTEFTTVGWKATFKCQTDERVGATVLDPFAGAGTTLLVAEALGRQAVGCEVSKDYCELIERRRLGKREQKLRQMEMV